MRPMIRPVVLLALLIIPLTAESCYPSSSDDKQNAAQEKIVAEGVAAVGMPAIHNFREKRQLKDIYEMRDQDGLVTYTYLYNEMQGTLVFFCNSIGFGIPYATQYTAPGKPYGEAQGYTTIPQADPNGLFSPADAEGTWVTCLGPDKQQHPVYVEPRVIVSPFPLK
jgi:hypothetical protein